MLDKSYIRLNISLYATIRPVVHWRRASALRYNKRRNVAMSSYDIDLI